MTTETNQGHPLVGYQKFLADIKSLPIPPRDPGHLAHLIGLFCPGELEFEITAISSKRTKLRTELWESIRDLKKVTTKILSNLDAKLLLIAHMEVADEVIDLPATDTLGRSRHKVALINLLSAIDEFPLISTPARGRPETDEVLVQIASVVRRYWMDVEGRDIATRQSRRNVASRFIWDPAAENLIGDVLKVLGVKPPTALRTLARKARERPLLNANDLDPDIRSADNATRG